ncbi:MAG TPA: hypothetical protein PKU71_15330, partial [bacterium]|nr:hypothetical protein [bacterium]
TSGGGSNGESALLMDGENLQSLRYTITPRTQAVKDVAEKSHHVSVFIRRDEESTPTKKIFKS